VTSTAGPSVNAWSSTPESVTVSAADASGSSGLSQITCTTPAGSASYQVSGDQASVVVPVSTPGADFVSCDSTSVAGNTSAAAYAAFNVDAQAPTVAFSGANSAPAWDTGSQTVTMTGTEAVQASGIASVSCQLDSGAWSTTPGSVAQVDVAGDGTHHLSCYTTTVAGVSGPTVGQSIQIDSQSPTLSFSDGPSQAGWHTTGQTIKATAVAVGGAAISAITCTVAGATLSYPNTTASANESIVVSVPAPGGDLDCQAQDSAGNLSSSKSWSFLIDDTVPTGYFTAGNTANPTQVGVIVADSGSGAAGATIQIDVNGGWQALQTAFDAGTGIATAQIPDDGSLADGAYALRAKVWDRAGNSGYITQDTTGKPESVTLPLRAITELTAVLTAGHAHVAATASAGSGHLSVRYGQRVRVAGQLETAKGVPVRHATIVISEQLSGGSVIQTVARTSTNGDGEFEYTLPAGPSRTLLVTYEGSPLLRSVSAQTLARVSGRVGISAPRTARVDRRVTVRGRVIGGHIPHAGLLVQLWYSPAGGQGGWEPFERAIRTRAGGSWALTFPVSAAASGRVYAFKAVVAAQSGWPYAGAVSAATTLRVV
jgi:hypothetical protein